jgi:multidrug efflux pump subunit AcrA (membrane-fusion protein)
MKRKSKRAMLQGALGAGLIATGFVGWQAVTDSSSAAPASRSVVTVTRGSVATTVAGTGNITAPATYDLSFGSSAASSLVSDILVKAGDVVTKGQPLAHVDATAAQAALTVAQVQLTSAQAALASLKAGPTSAQKGEQGLGRFLCAAPLDRVHECVFGVLALESEPVDPRL